MNDLTPREDELLRLIQQWCAKYDLESVVERKWIENKMSVSTSRLSDLKKSLILKEFLEKDRKNFILPSSARKYISKKSDINTYISTPAYLPIAGQVRAGKAKQDELRIELVEM